MRKVKKSTVFRVLAVLAVVAVIGIWVAVQVCSVENQLFWKWFEDPPLRTEAMGIGPTGRDEEIIQACQEIGISDPVFPFGYEKGWFYYRTIHLSLGKDTGCRCTYYIFTQEGEVKSAWIEAQYEEDGFYPDIPVRVFSANTSREEILDAFRHDS